MASLPLKRSIDDIESTLAKRQALQSSPIAADDDIMSPLPLPSTPSSKSSLPLKLPIPNDNSQNMRIFDDDDYIESDQIILNSHQKSLVERICKKCRLQYGILIWHTMGSGKTITTLNILMNLPFKTTTPDGLYIQHKRVIILPLGTENTWKKEASNLGLYNEGDTTKFITKFNDPLFGMQNIHIITYDDIKIAINESLVEQQKFFNKYFKNNVVVFDESQHLLKIKKDNNQINKDITELEKALKNCFKILFLTGTPVNIDIYELEDYYNMLHIDSSGGKSFDEIIKHKQNQIDKKSNFIVKNVNQTNKKTFIEKKLGQKDIIFLYIKKYIKYLGFFVVVLVSFMFLTIPVGFLISVMVVVIKKIFFPEEQVNVEKHKQLQLELEKIQDAAHQDIVNKILNTVDKKEHTEIIAELMVPYISYYDYKVNTDFEELTKYPNTSNNDYSIPKDSKKIHYELTNYHIIDNRQDIYEQITTFGNLVSQPKKDFLIKPINMNIYQTFIYSKYKIQNSNPTMTLTIHEQNILNISNNLGEGEGQQVFAINSKKRSDELIRKIGNISFDCEYFETMRSIEDENTGNQVYLPIPKIDQINHLIKKCKKYKIFFIHQMNQTNTELFLNEFYKFWKDIEFNSYFINEIYFVKKEETFVLTKEKLIKLCEIIDKDIGELEKIHQLIRDSNSNQKSLNKLNVISNNDDRKIFLKIINIYKHIIIRAEIQYYFLEEKNGPFGLGFYEETTVLDPEQRLVQYTNFYKKWSIYQLFIVQMINNCNTYNLFNCDKFKKALEIMTDNSGTDSRINNNYLPCVYSNFDLFGYKLFSAFLTYKNINHLILESDKLSKINSNIEYLANIPHYKLKKEIVVADIKSDHENINMYIDIKNNYYNKIALEKTKSYLCIHIFSNFTIDYEYMNSLTTDEEINRIRDDFLIKPIENISEITITKYSMSDTEEDEINKLGLNRLELIKVINNRDIFPYNNEIKNKNMLCMIISKNIKEGVDFPLSPAIHVLETPIGYSDSNQIYARILRTINSNEPYDFIKQFINQYKLIKKQFDNPIFKEILTIDDADLKLTTIFNNINKFDKLYKRLEIRYKSNVEYIKTGQLLSELMLKIKQTVKTIDQCTKEPYNYINFKTDYKNVLIKYYIKGEGIVSASNEIKLDDSHYTTSLNYINQYLLILENGIDWNIQSINKQFSLISQAYNLNIHDLPKMDEYDIEILNDLFTNNEYQTISEILKSHYNDTLPESINTFLEVLKIKCNLFKILNYSNIKNQIELDNVIKSKNKDDELTYIIFENSETENLFYSKEKILKFNKNSKTLNVDTFDIKTSKYDFKNINYKKNCIENDKNIECTINEIIFIEKSIKRCKKIIYQYTLNMSNIIYSLDINGDIDINIDPKKFINKLKIDYSDKQYKIARKDLIDAQINLHIKLLSNNQLIKHLSDLHKDIKYKEYIQKKEICQFFFTNYNHVKTYITTIHISFNEYFVDSFNLKNKISEIIRKIEADIHSFNSINKYKPNHEYTNRLDEKQNNLCIELQKIYHLFEIEFHQLFGMGPRIKKRINENFIVKNIVNFFKRFNNKEIINKDNANSAKTEQLILSSLDSHIIKYFIYTTGNQQLTGQPLNDFNNKIIQLINKENLSDLTDYNIIQKNISTKKYITTLVDFLKKKTCNDNNCNIDDNPQCGLGKLPLINISFKNPLKFTYIRYGLYVELILEFDSSSMPVELQKLKPQNQVKLHNFIFKFISDKSFFDDREYTITKIENTKFTLRDTQIQDYHNFEPAIDRHEYTLIRDLEEKDIDINQPNNLIKDNLEKIIKIIPNLLDIINFIPKRIEMVIKEYARIDKIPIEFDANMQDLPFIAKETDQPTKIYSKKLEYVYNTYIWAQSKQNFPETISEYINYVLYIDEPKYKYINDIFNYITRIIRKLISVEMFLKQNKLKDILDNIDIFSKLYIELNDTKTILNIFNKILNDNKLVIKNKICYEKKTRNFRIPIFQKGEYIETHKDKKCIIDMQCLKVNTEDEKKNNYCDIEKLENDINDDSETQPTFLFFMNYLPEELVQITNYIGDLSSLTKPLERLTKEFQISLIEKCDLLYPINNDFTSNLNDTCESKINKYCRCIGYNMKGGVYKKKLDIDAKLYINKLIEKSEIYLIFDENDQNQTNHIKVISILDIIIQKLKLEYDEKEIQDYFYEQIRYIILKYENKCNKIIKTEIWGYTLESLSTIPILYHNFNYIGIASQLKDELLMKFPCSNSYFTFDLYLWFNEKLLKFISSSIYTKSMYQDQYIYNNYENDIINLLIFDNIIKKKKTLKTKNEYVDIIYTYINSLKLETKLPNFLSSPKYGYKFKSFKIGLYKKENIDIEIDSISYTIYDWNMTNNKFNCKLFLINKNLQSGLYYFKMYLPNDDMKTDEIIITSKYFKIGYLEKSLENIEFIDSYDYYPLYSPNNFGNNFVENYTFMEGVDNELYKTIIDEKSGKSIKMTYFKAVCVSNYKNNNLNHLRLSKDILKNVIISNDKLIEKLFPIQK
jgi:hypothetical protein